METLKTAGVDFETYYRDKTYSVRDLGVRNYVDHPEFDPYLVSIHTSDGGEWCGPPAEFDFNEIADYIWLSHNKGFDYAVYRAFCRDTKTPVVKPVDWFCTADMGSYFGLPRDLGTLLHFLYGTTLDKGVRAAMSARKWDDLTPEQKKELVDYALEDVRYLPKFWSDYAEGWPEHERRISNLTIRMRFRGLPVDDVKLDKSIKEIRKQMEQFEKDMPWWDGPTKKNKTPLSDVLMAEQCRKVGIEAPVSRAKESPHAAAWIEKYGKKYRYVQAMQGWNSGNTLLQKMITLQERVIFPDPGDFAFEEESPDFTRKGDLAWMPYGMRYCGTHTGRDAGGDGFNVLNFNKEKVLGIDLRNLFVAPKGYKFLSADYSQIEPRVLAWLVGNEEFLDRIRGGEDPYVAFGLSVMGHQGEWTKNDRAVWKMMVLQLGYQSGAEKFQGAAKAKGGLDLDLSECKKLVRIYRAKNRRVTNFWRDLEKEMRSCLKTKGGTGTYMVELPSGRNQYYRNVAGNKSLRAVIAGEKGFRETHFYGGMLCENVVQAASRDIFFSGYLNIEDAGIPIVLRIYDEFLGLVKEKDAEKKAVEMKRIMETPPEWAPDLPIGAEVHILDYYQKS